MTAVTRTKPGLELVQDIHKLVFGKEDPSLNEVCIDNKCMDATEVTDVAYAVVMERSILQRDPYMPATLLTYKDADQFCKKVGQRLPTSNEWKLFAGPNDFATHSGRLVNEKNEKEANFEDIDGVKRVASYLPNSFGMYDMTGNVAEWVSDGTAFYRLLHGGSWYNGYGDSGFLTNNVTDSASLYYANYSAGFRCMRDI